MTERKTAIAGEEKSKITQAKELVESHESAKRQTDKMILGIKDAKIRQKYVAKRQEQRGKFGQILDSITSKFLEYASQVEGFFDSMNPFAKKPAASASAGPSRGQVGAYAGSANAFARSDSSMGFLMLAPAAVKVALVAASAAVLYAAATYAAAVKKEKDLQEEILKDPKLSTAEKARLVAVVSGDVIGQKAGAVLVPLLLLGGGFLVLKAMSGARNEALGAGLDAASRFRARMRGVGGANF